LLGGATNGITALVNGKTFWSGNLKPPPMTPATIRPELPSLNSSKPEVNTDGLRSRPLEMTPKRPVFSETLEPGPITVKLSGELREVEIATDGGRVFWSSGGNPVVKTTAESFAAKNGMTTLEMTKAGQNLTNLTKGMTWAERAPMWQRLSTQFATGAKGTVHVFQNAGGIGVNSVWGTIEYSILRSNGVNIIYHIVP
jgi:hypothetical protein